MSSDMPTTCGEGLAAHAPLPRTIGALLAAMADVLGAHRQALDRSDDAVGAEHEAYGRLSEELRAVADRLTAIAELMTGYRTLPMGRHDERRLSGPESRRLFARFVSAEENLLALLGEAVPQDREMLAGWDR